MTLKMGKRDTERDVGGFKYKALSCVLVQVAETLGHSAYKATWFSASLNRLNMFSGV